MPNEPGTLREGWVEIAPGVSTPLEAVLAEATVRWNHIDGPLLSWAGQLHWLTWRERFAIWIGRETPDTIAQKHWPLRKRYADFDWVCT
jgi:hypothetical protein